MRVSDIVKSSGKTHASYLHVFVKLADVESVSIRTLMRELSLANPAAAEEQLAERFLSRPSSRWVMWVAQRLSSGSAEEQQKWLQQMQSSAGRNCNSC